MSSYRSRFPSVSISVTDGIEIYPVELNQGDVYFNDALHAKLSLPASLLLAEAISCPDELIPMKTIRSAEIGLTSRQRVADLINKMGLSWTGVDRLSSSSLVSGFYSEQPGRTSAGTLAVGKLEGVRFNSRLDDTATSIVISGEVETVDESKGSSPQTQPPKLPERPASKLRKPGDAKPRLDSSQQRLEGEKPGNFLLRTVLEHPTGVGVEELIERTKRVLKNRNMDHDTGAAIRMIDYLVNASERSRSQVKLVSITRGGEVFLAARRRDAPEPLSEEVRVRSSLDKNILS